MLCGNKDNDDAEFNHTYRISPKENWKLAIFDNGNATINDETYYISSFINSDEFIIHEVISMINQKGYSNRAYFHVWYENKQ